MEDMDLSGLEKRILRRARDLTELRAEPYYARRSEGNAKTWVVMRGPTIAEGVAAELTDGMLMAARPLRGGFTHDRARSVARALNEKYAKEQK